MRIAIASLAIAALGCAASAQIVSPPGFASIEGGSHSTMPFFGTSFRYQQLHNDVKGKVFVCKGLSFRRDSTNSTRSNGKTITGTFWMGQGDYSKATPAFATNYNKNGRTAVIPATTISLPRMPVKPTTPPAAFTVHIPFKTAYIYLGAEALIWETVITKMSAMTSYVMDAESTGSSTVGPFKVIGKGCTATGQTRPMISWSFLQTYRLPDRFHYFHYTYYGPKNAAAAILVGLTNPNLPFPICNGRLYTDAVVGTIPGRTDASGYFNSGTALFAPYVAALVGKKIYSQSYIVDAAQKPLPIAVANGVEATIPARGSLPQPVARIYAQNGANMTSGSFMKRYILVTRFNK